MLEHCPYDQNTANTRAGGPKSARSFCSYAYDHSTAPPEPGSARGLAAASPQGENLQAAERVNSDSKHNRICDLNSVGNTEGTVSECQECLTAPIDFPLDRSIARVELT